MTRGTRRFDPDTAEQRVRRPLRVAQPESTAALRPSQRRAAENRASLTARAPSDRSLGPRFRRVDGARTARRRTLIPHARTRANRGQAAGKVFGVSLAPGGRASVEVAGVADHLTYWPANGSGAAVRTAAD